MSRAKAAKRGVLIHQVNDALAELDQIYETEAEDKGHTAARTVYEVAEALLMRRVQGSRTKSLYERTDK